MKKKLAILAAFSLILTACSDDSNGSSPKVEKPSVCGDTVVGSDEACDDGNTESEDGCSSDCKTVEDGWNCPKSGGKCTKKSSEGTSVCGDSEVSADEACDDGNTESEDGCSSDCKTVEDGWNCPKSGGKCTKSGVSGDLCGNGVIDGDEKCDDKNAVDGDGCSSDCMTIEENYRCDEPGKPCVLSTCGNGELDSGEECDEGEDNVDYDLSPGACSTNCHPAHYCGDGLWDEVDRENGEECDAGRDTSGEYGGCTLDCLRSLYCGDGVIQPEHEQCDDGNEADGDGCSASCGLEAGFACQTVSSKSECRSLLCGNGKLDEGEQCDDGAENNVGGYGKCNSECHFDTYCGDGIVQEGFEQCDDGAGNGSSSCSKSCEIPVA